MDDRHAEVLSFAQHDKEEQILRWECFGVSVGWNRIEWRTFSRICVRFRLPIYIGNWLLLPWITFVLFTLPPKKDELLLKGLNGEVGGSESTSMSWLVLDASKMGGSISLATRSLNALGPWSYSRWATCLQLEAKMSDQGMVTVSQRPWDILEWTI